MYPGQPYQQAPAPIPPQKKKPSKVARGCGIVAGVVIVIIVIAVIASATSHNSTTTASTSNTTTVSATQAPTTAPTSAASGTLSKGQSATVDGWKATVNNVSTTQGNSEIDSLKSGDTFLLVDVTVVNNTGSAQTFSSIISFSLKDSTGQTYNETIVSTAPSTPDGNVSNGSPLRGTVAYEVPSSMHSFTLTFTPSLGSTDSATWSLGD
jgi:hypothetical protein